MEKNLIEIENQGIWKKLWGCKFHKEIETIYVEQGTKSVCCVAWKMKLKHVFKECDMARL